MKLTVSNSGVRSFESGTHPWRHFFVCVPRGAGSGDLSYDASRDTQTRSICAQHHCRKIVPFKPLRAGDLQPGATEMRCRDPLEGLFEVVEPISFYLC